MATELHVKSGGSWRKAKEVHVKASGAWRKAKEVWVKASGTWRKVFQSFSPTEPIPLTSLENNPLEAYFFLRTNGVMDWNFNNAPVSGNWALPTTTDAGAAYWARVTVLTGNSPTGTPGAGTWYNLGTEQVWVWNTLGPDYNGTFKLEIASDSGGENIVATAASVPWSVYYV
jgi:hypothetical protein